MMLGGGITRLFTRRNKQFTPRRAFKGMWGGKEIKSGNRIAFSNKRSRVFIYPNVRRLRFYSESLGRVFKMRATTFVSRWIDYAGGLDNYLTTTHPSKLAPKPSNKIKGEWPVLKLRAKVLAAKEAGVQERLVQTKANERAATTEYLRASGRSPAALKFEEEVARMNNKI